MKILSLHDGHNASTCYLENGAIKHLLLEERFTGKKNQGGFPEKSLDWLKQQPDFDLSSLDFIAIGGFDLPVYDVQTKNSFFRRLFSLASLIIPNSIISSQKLIKPYLYLIGKKRKKQLAGYATKYNLDPAKIKQIEHHTAHGYAALYGSGFVHKKEPVLIFTADNSGDGVSASISIWENEKKCTRIHENQSFNSLGEPYAAVTEYLGMKRWEHEYKVMGMAPYVADEYSEDLFQLLKKDYLDLSDDKLKFINKATHGNALLRKMKKDFFKVRFDNICGAIQRHFEYLLIEWVSSWAKKTNIKNAVFGGGCFMNVKANMLIADLDFFQNVFFMPSASDESTAIGAAYKLHEKNSTLPVPKLGSLYKGPRYSLDEIKNSLEKYADKINYEEKDDIEATVAKLIADYKIVARFKGNLEWGARALGNRSIICRADDLKIIHKLNKSIKMRDFWMPFAASILEEDTDRYLINPKQIPAPYMVLAFQTKPLAHQQIMAGLHPFDHTCRPNLVSKEWNPDYHRLISLFKEKTGISGVLNTSFNLHGKPIAGSPVDAIETLINSDLDYLAIENYLVWKK